MDKKIRTEFLIKLVKMLLECLGDAKTNDELRLMMFITQSLQKFLVHEKKESEQNEQAAEEKGV